MASMEELLGRRITRAVGEGVFPCCVAGIVEARGRRSVFPFGKFTYDHDAPSARPDSIFDAASLTKSIPTSCLALKLLEQGRLGLDHQLIAYVPEFRGSHRERVLIRHLLTHTLHFGFRLSEHRDGSPDALLEAIFTAELVAAPGQAYHYANATSVLLGLVVERIYGKDLGRAADETFFGPLGMGRTSLDPGRFDREEIVPTEFDPWRGRLVRGEVHDESAFTLRKKIVPGSAGLFSTVPDMLNFLEMLLNGGRYQGKEFFRPETVAAMETDHAELPGVSAGLGWEINQPRYMGRCCTPRTFGKTGFTGCSCVCDRSAGVALVLLSNYTFPRRKDDAAMLNEVRSDCADIVLSPYA